MYTVLSWCTCFTNVAVVLMIVSRVHRRQRLHPKAVNAESARGVGVDARRGEIKDKRQSALHRTAHHKSNITACAMCMSI